MASRMNLTSSNPEPHTHFGAGSPLSLSCKADCSRFVSTHRHTQRNYCSCLNIMAMAMRRVAARYVPRRFSSSGKILSEEEKAAENVYIKKIEKEKLEKLARQGPKPEEKSTASDIKANATASGSSTTSSTFGVSTDKNRNYAVVAGVVTGLGALGWYFLSKDKKTEEVQD